MYKIATQKYKIIDAHCTTQNIKIVNGKISIRNISNIFSNIKDDYYRQIVYHYFFKKIINTIESQTINIIYEGPEFYNINNILNDSDIYVLQQNYNYLFWAILASGMLLVSMNVLK